MLAVIAGGQPGDGLGWTASRLAATTFSEHYFSHADGDQLRGLQHAVNRTNSTIYSFRSSSDKGQASRFGTTIAAAALDQQQAYILTVGGSRVYQIRGQQIVWCTSEQSGKDLLGQSAILQIPLSGRADNRYSFVVNLRPGDALALCSAEVWRNVAEAELATLAIGLPAQAAADQLVAKARERRGSSDGHNTSAAVIQYGIDPRRGKLSPFLIGGAALLLAAVLAILMLRQGGLPGSSEATAIPTQQAGGVAQSTAPSLMISASTAAVTNPIVAQATNTPAATIASTPTINSTATARIVTAQTGTALAIQAATLAAAPTETTTFTAAPELATATQTPAEATATLTATATPELATATQTPAEATATLTATATPELATATQTPAEATATPELATATQTPAEATATLTATATPELATATQTPAEATATPAGGPLITHDGRADRQAVPQGETISFEAQGFLPNEHLTAWATPPGAEEKESIFCQTLKADANGHVTWSWEVKPHYVTGIWRMVAGNDRLNVYIDFEVTPRRGG
ncbi:MAG: hypothetical protein HGA45_11845 [Chloroflexales bacterium]|nr:hypothetical protein [Chloroflexales bacterium]